MRSWSEGGARTGEMSSELSQLPYALLGLLFAERA